VRWPGFYRCRYQSAHYAAEFPRAWEIDTAFDPQKANQSGSDEEDDGSSAEGEANVQAVPTHVGNLKDRRSPGFADFLQFLELSCGGSPLQGYPAVVVILSSIPPPVGIHPPPFFFNILLTQALTFHRSYCASPPVHSSPRSGPPSMVELSAPSTAPPRLPLSLVLYLSVQPS
jgi:hypothetical protein